MITFALFRLFWAGNRAGSQFKGSEPKFDMSYFTNTVPGQLPVKKFQFQHFPVLRLFLFCHYKSQRTFQKNINPSFFVQCPYLKGETSC